MLPLRLLFLLLLPLTLLLSSCSPSPLSAPPEEARCSIPFELLRLSPQPLEPEDDQAVVDLVFTGPPDLPSLRDVAIFRLDGNKVDTHLAPLPEDPKVVRATLALEGEGWSAVPMVQATVHLNEGVRCAHNAALVAPNARISVDLVPAIPPVTVATAEVHEADDGHYVEVLCRDHAVEQLWSNYRNGARRKLSERCMPDLEAAVGGVSIEPAMRVEIVATRGGFLVYGDFAQGPVTIEIEAGTPTVDGGRFYRLEQIELEIPELTPRLSFLSQGRYLPRGSLQRLGIRHRNVERARLEVRHVPPENLVFWMSGREPTDARSSDRVLLERIDLASEPDQTGTTWLDLGQRLPWAKNGLYEITLHAVDPEDEETDSDDDHYDRYWWGGRFHEARAAARVLLTDLQLVAKRSAVGPGEPWSSEVLVWALDTHGAGLLSEVSVELVRPSGTALGRCTTDDRGGCRIQVDHDAVDPEPPSALVARRGSDICYLAFEDLELEPHGDVHGEPYQAESQVRAAAWTERGVYRPGDAVHLAAILRGVDDVAPPPGLPVTLVVRDPQGQELRRQVLETNAAGLLASDLQLRDYARTGRYHVELEVAERQVGSTRFLVEEIAPERMEVTLAATEVGLLPSEAAEMDLDARWLFGAAASGSKVELDCTLRGASFSPRDNVQLHYGPSSISDETQHSTPLAIREGTLDDHGHTTLRCPAAATVGELAQPASLSVRAVVFEGASGRASRAQAAVPIHPERFYIGLEADQAQARAGVPVNVQGLLVDWQGQALTESTATVSVRILRVEREYGASWHEGTQDFRYGRWYRRSEEQRLELLPEDGTLSFTFTPSERAWGYLVEVTAGKARTELLVEGEQASWMASGLRSTPEPDRAGWLEVQAPDETHPGDRVPISIEVDDAGWLLLTAETDQVIAHRWQRVQPGTARWSFRLREYVPNVYVSALLVRDPHRMSAQAYQPGRAHGLRSIRVQPEPYEGRLALTLPDEIRPRETLEVGVKLEAGEGPRWVAIAAVDEGLLSLTKHESPNPLPHLFEPRALGVESFETVGWSLSLPSQAPTSAAGGDRTGAKARVQTIKPVALWSGLVEVPASGFLTVPLEVPDHRGALRVMAVGASASHVAATDARVLVREPLLVQVSPPRFLVEGDRARVPIAVSNLDERARDLQLSVSIEPLGDSTGATQAQPLAKVLGPTERTLHLDMGERASLDVELTALEGQGAVQVIVTTTSDSLHSEQRIDLPITAARPTERHVSREPLASESHDLTPLLAGWTRGSAELWVTDNPYADVLAQREDLLGYPYGCLEQTSSQTRLLVALDGLFEESEPGRPLDAWVQAGIDRVQIMQTSSGGFSYWPGGRGPSHWASTYALHVLLDARDAGHPVPADMLERGLAYLERQLVHGARAERAYAHFVLARAGRGQPALARSEIGGASSDRESTYLLMAAVHLAGDHRFRQELSKLQPFVEQPSQQRRHPFGSSLREQGLVLATFRDLFGADAAGQILTDAVAAGLRDAGSRYATTQELAWGLTALAGSVKSDGLEGLHPVLERDGRLLSANEGTDTAWSLGDLLAERLVLRPEHDGERSLWLVMDARGLRDDGGLVLAQGAVLEREVLNIAGEPADLGALEVGQLLYVRTTARSLRGRQPHVALVDRLPAGWEVENPAITGASLPAFLTEASRWETEHVNLRDDRIEAFGTIDETPRSQVYAVRVVTAGSFTWPGVLLEAMYDPGVRARTAPTELSIQPRPDAELL